MENNENDQGSIRLSTKCQQLRKPLVVVSLVVVSSDNLISLAWMSDLEMKNFIFLWTATGLALNMLVTMGIPLKNRRIIQIWLCIQGIDGSYQNYSKSFSSLLSPLLLAKIFLSSIGRK